MGRMGATVFPRVIVRSAAGAYLRLPALTTTQRDALSGVASGFTIYNSTTNTVDEYVNGSWISLCDVSSAQTLTNKRLTSPKINEDVPMTATATSINLIDDDDYLAVLAKSADYMCIGTGAGWSSSVVGSGTFSQSPFGLDQRTGVTASSKSLTSCLAYGINKDQSYIGRVNWGQKLYLIFNYGRESSDAQVIARVQLKETNTEGQLAAKGIGLQIDNMWLSMETYGTSRGLVEGIFALPDNDSTQIVIIHYPGSKIECYVNGVLMGTQSTAAFIPSGASGATAYLVHSIINGATGGVDAISFLCLPRLWVSRA